MPKALSVDLRSRIAEAVAAGETVRRAAQRFGVSAATAVGLTRFGGHPEALARGVPDAQDSPAVFT